MILNIINEAEKIYVKFANQTLEVSENSPTWNMVEINKFLIDLATKTPDGQLIEIKFDDELVKENQIYNHIVLLFSEFVKKYNSEIANQTNN